MEGSRGEFHPVRPAALDLALCLAVIAMIGATVLPGMAAPAAEEALMVEETLLPVTIDGKAAKLDVLIAREPGAARPLPIALFTHGQTADPKVRARLKARNFSGIARDLARRGWLAVVVLRRGYGRSEVAGGKYRTPRCRNRNYRPSIDEQTDDLEAVLKAIGKRPDADPARILAMGLSVGGLTALNLATRDIPGLKATVSFSGGIVTSPAKGKKPGPKICRGEDLLRWLEQTGAKQKAPSLWLYADNDRLFSPDFIRRMDASYGKGGGKAQLHIFGPSGKDGHRMFGDRKAVLHWLPALDTFLRANRLPTFDPAPLEAALRPFNPGPGVRSIARAYHGRHAEKALAISPKGNWVATHYDADDPARAEGEALRNCNRISGETCRILWRNFDVR
ncbi:MAG: serine aminopeptidase domain-containing protein [Phyllobacterium sp.]